MEPEPKRDVLEAALKRAFPNHAADLIAKAIWSSLNGCWLVQFAGMTVGIERDGYVHS